MPETKYEVDHWLIENGHRWPNLSSVLGDLAEKLESKDMELTRALIYLPTLNPQVETTLSVWRKDDGFIETSNTATVLDVNERVHKFGILKDINLGHRHEINPAYKVSPMYKVIVGGRKEIVAKLNPGLMSYDFPAFRDFSDSGATGYFGHELLLGENQRSFVSFVTAQNGGFTHSNLTILRSICGALSLIVDRFNAHRVANTLVKTYLGNEPGKMVLSGQIQQGDVKRINAAIWFSDLRDYTERSSVLQPEDLIALLNNYFGIVCPIIEHAGGEILKFIGDAILGIFPTRNSLSSKQVCVAALNAAMESESALEELNKSRSDPLNHGIALHFGEIQYGNIGAENRLDFTVIGKAVNLTARIEDLCAEQKQSLLISRKFFKLVGCESTSIGEFTLKGIPDRQRIYVPLR
jgi:adenylate cyclase